MDVNPISSHIPLSNSEYIEDTEMPEIMKVSLRIIMNKAVDIDVKNLAERLSVSRDTVTAALKIFRSKFENDSKDISAQSQHSAFIFEVAKSAAKKDGRKTSQRIQEYGIIEQGQLIEIAKVAAVQDGRGTSACIKNYGIKDQEQRVEIAKLAAEQSGWGTSTCINNYGIEDQKQLFEIAKIAAAQDGGGTSRYIKKYGIEGQEQLIEIAKIAAAQDGLEASKFIQNYGIKGQMQLFEIVKVAAAQSGRGASYYIQNYGIKDQEQLVEVAKIAAAQDGCETSDNIQNYGIKDRMQLFEIAKIAAAQDGRGTSEYIQNYGIENQGQLVEIAKVAAAQGGKGISVHIQNYRIKGQEQLVEIAKIAAAQNGLETSYYIQNYGIKDQEQLIEIAKIAAAQNGWGASQYIQKYGIDKGKLTEVMLFCLLGNVRSVERLSNFGLGVRNFRSGASRAKQVVRALELIEEEPFVSQSNIQTQLLEALFKMPNPEARRAAAQLLIQLEKEKRFEAREPLDIVRILTGLKFKISTKTFKKSNLLSQILITSRDLLKVGEAKRLLPLALGDIARKRKRNLQAASALIGMGDIERLKGIETKEDFAVALKEAFAEKFNLGEIENFEEKYAKTFGSYREGNSLMVYYGDVCKLPPADKEAVMKDLCTFVREVLEGTFSTNRYENSSHIEGLDIDFWKEDIFKTIELSASGSSFDFTKLLKTKFADGHLPEEVYKSLEPYLGDPKFEVKEDFTPLQKALMMLMRKGTSELTKVQKALKKEYPSAEFNNDVQGWIEESNKSSSGIKKYTLAFTADPWDLFRMGEVPGSCQRVGGTPSQNQGLIGTALDGKNKLVAIKDPSGKIVARSILRLMRHEGKPALFIERPYPQTCSEAFKGSLLEMAKEVAARGGVELYTQEYEGTATDITLTSLESRAYSEYVDAAGGIQMRGVFEIRNLKKVS